MGFRRLVSKLFPNTTSPRDGLDELHSISQMLLYRRRLVETCYPGSYTLNTYMFRAVRKLEKVVDYYMEGIGGQRICMPSLSPATLWKQTGRWDSMGKELFRLNDRSYNQLCLSPTHEESICSLLSNHLISYKSLPLLLYQVTTKFRDEPHPKHALLRSREFLMKDMYTFDRGQEEATATYNKVVECYEDLLRHLSLDYIKVAADTGAIGGSMSHEFHIEAEIGEDSLNVCQACGQSINSELLSAVSDQCERKECAGHYRTLRGIEVAHAFLLGERYSKPLNVTYMDAKARSRFAYMGCYGIGVTRLLGAAMEVMSSKDQMKLPRAIAPYSVIVIPQKKGYKCAETLCVSQQLYDQLESHPLLSGEVILDDRLDQSIGFRLREARLLGYPMAVCVTKQSLQPQPLVELIDLYDNQTEMVHPDRLPELLAEKVVTVR